MEQIFRQKDPQYIKIINDLMFGNVTKDVEDWLEEEKCAREREGANDGVIICSTNEEVDKYIQEDVCSRRSHPSYRLYEAFNVAGQITFDKHLPKEIELSVGSKVFVTSTISASIEYGTLYPLLPKGTLCYVMQTEPKKVLVQWSHDGEKMTRWVSAIYIYRENQAKCKQLPLRQVN